VNLSCSRIGGVAKSEVGPGIVRRDEAAARQDILAHAHAIRFQIDRGAHCIARALRTPDQLQLHPVMMIRIHIPEQCRGSVDGADDDVDLSIVKQVTKRRATSRSNDGQA
jgi:hypothetical protein